MSLDFTAKFIVNRISGNFQLVLTDTSDFTGLSFVSGFWRVEYPDGIFVENTDQNSPDFTIASRQKTFTLRQNNGLILGNYRITQKAYSNTGFQQNEVVINLMFTEPLLVLADNSNTATPQVSFINNTDSVVGNYTILTEVQTISSSFPTGVVASPLSTTQEILAMSNTGQYYEGVYNPLLNVDIEYQGTGHTVEYINEKPFVFDVRRSPQINELVNLLNTLKSRLDNASGQERTKLEQAYQQLVSIYSHIIAKTRVGQGGTQELINEMLKVAYSACCYCFSPSEYEYSILPLEPFDDSSFEFILRDVFEYSDNNVFELRFAPLSIFQIFRNGKLLVLQDLEYSVSGKNITILENMVVGDEIVVYYSIVESTFLTDLSEYVDRAEDAAQLALGQAILAAAARDAAEGFALQSNASRIAAEDAADRAEVSKIEWQGDWIAGTYQANDAVGHLGSSWIANKITSEEPSLLAADWDLLAKKGDDGVGGGSGTVTSVAISGSDGIEIDSGSPITTSGTIVIGINAANLRTHINVEDGAKAFPEASERENNTVIFDQNYIIGNASARTGNILFDFTGAKLGAWTEMKHQDASAFTFPTEAMLMFDTADISTTVANYFLFVLTDKTASSEVVKVFHAIEGGV